VDGFDMEATIAISPDVMSLGAATLASSIRVTQAFGECSSTRRGEHPTTEIRISIKGTDAQGFAIELGRTVTAVDQELSLTALTIVLVLERCVGLLGPKVSLGLYLTEHLFEPAGFVALMRAAGAIVNDEG
jgi:hypothetical protein